MDLRLTDEQLLIQKMARDFAEGEIAPVAAESDEQARAPRDILRTMGELGFMGLTASEAYDGGGLDTVSYVLALEEISKACAAIAVVMSIQNSLVNYCIEQFGNEEQRQRYLPRLAAGEWIGAFAITEPNAGSDVGATSTTARLDGDGYVIDGVKQFITNGSFADLIVLFASTDRSKGARGLTAFLVERDTPGFSAGPEVHKMGIRASSTSELIFEGCRLPAGNVLGAPGQGFKIAMQALDGGRIGIAAQSTGIAEAAYRASLKYARERQQFGQPIAQFQAIQWILADMATRIEAARLLTWSAAMRKDAGEPYSQQAAMCKVFASETATWVTGKAIQVHGGYGYMKEYPVERYFRDAKVTEIYEGTSEIQRLVIAHSLLRG
jgi:butyryl-CoA dehydrogenase